VLDLDAIYSGRGPLSRAVRGFRARPFQVEMARAVAEAIAAKSVLVAEAGTGTGKTFAYLVPALLTGGKVIVSTGTKTLQDQLFDRDIPTVRSALGAPVTVALLKGRANYVCHHHLERAAQEARFPAREDARHLVEIQRFTRGTPTGDKADCAAVPEHAGIWSYVTSTRENCLGSKCQHYDACFVMKARREALAADVVVVNHHLFFADLVLREKLATDAPFAGRFYRALCIFLADRMRSATRRLGYGDAVADEVAARGELNENVMDTVHLAGARFDRMLKRLAG